MNWFSRVTILSVAAMLPVIFTVPLSASPSVTMEPAVVKIGDKITVTIESDGWILKGGPIVKGPGEGSLTSTGGTLTATGPGYVIVSTYWVHPNGNGGEEEMSATGTAKVVFVSLEPVSAGNNPDISPNICTNAQSDYATAKWKATVLPEGTKAKITTKSSTILWNEPIDPVGSMTFNVYGIKKGEYVLNISHCDLASCQAEGKGVVFELKPSFKRLSVGPSVFDLNRWQEVAKLSEDRFLIISAIESGIGDTNLSVTLNAASTLSFSMESEPKIELPSGVFVKAPTHFQVITGVILHTFSIPFWSLDTATISFLSGIDLSGLESGDIPGAGGSAIASGAGGSYDSDVGTSVYQPDAIYELNKRVNTKYTQNIYGTKTAPIHAFARFAAFDGFCYTKRGF